MPTAEKPRTCAHCDRPATLLCDHPVGKDGTCDRPLCDDHAARRGAGFACSRGRGGSGCRSFTIDYCPEHAPLHS